MERSYKAFVSFFNKEKGSLLKSSNKHFLSEKFAERDLRERIRVSILYPCNTANEVKNQHVVSSV